MNFSGNQQSQSGSERSRVIDPRTLGGGERFWVHQKGAGPREAIKLRSEEIGTIVFFPASESDEGAFMVESTVKNIFWVVKSIVPHDQEARSLPYYLWPRNRSKFEFEEGEYIEIGDVEAATPQLARIRQIETVRSEEPRMQAANRPALFELSAEGTPLTGDSADGSQRMIGMLTEQMAEMQRVMMQEMAEVRTEMSTMRNERQGAREGLQQASHGEQGTGMQAQIAAAERLIAQRAAGRLTLDAESSRRRQQRVTVRAMDLFGDDRSSEPEAREDGIGQRQERQEQQRPERQEQQRQELQEQTDAGSHFLSQLARAARAGRGRGSDDSSDDGDDRETKNIRKLAKRVAKAPKRGRQRWVKLLEKAAEKAGLVHQTSVADTSALSLYFTHHSNLHRHALATIVLGAVMQIDAAMQARDSDHVYATLSGLVVFLDQMQHDNGQLALAQRASLLRREPVAYQPKKEKYSAPPSEAKAFAPLVEAEVVQVAGAAIREQAKLDKSAAEILKSHPV